MTKRQIIIVVGAALLLAIGKVSMDYMAVKPEKKKLEDTERIVTVFTEIVALSDIPIAVRTTGSLEAKQRMELYSEVQGLMLPDNGRFNAGNTFSKGQTLISLRADDARARVVAARSGYERLLSTVMADIRLDYPSDYPAWSAYLKSIDVQQSLPQLPSVADEQLDRYLTGRSVYSEYHTVRNAEIGLTRYRISAPFSGVLISASADPGTVVRPGQLLGILVRPGVYEMQASTDANTIAKLAVGQSVDLYADGQPSTTYTGTISRINASIDPQTQMSSFFVEVTSDELKDGQYMNLSVSAESVADAFEIDRSAVQDSRYVFVVKNGLLSRVEIDIAHATDATAIIKGLQPGQEVLTKLPPAAFEGMKVKVYSDKEAS